MGGLLAQGQLLCPQACFVAIMHIAAPNGRVWRQVGIAPGRTGPAGDGPDRLQVQAEGVNLTRTIAVAQNEVRFADSSTEFVLARKKPGVTVPRDPALPPFAAA